MTDYKRKILFVAIPNSIHTARWIGQLANSNFNLHIFPSIDAEIHDALRNIKIYDSYLLQRQVGPGVRQINAIPIPPRLLPPRLNYFISRLLHTQYFRKIIKPRSLRLANLIKKLKPDLIHSLEFQHGGYLTLDAKNIVGDSFPKWIATNWGSDIFLFGKLPGHSEKVKELLSSCDYYSCECQRDVELAKTFGYKGHVLPVLPNSGGFDLDIVYKLRQPGLPADRKLILLKGYQTWAGRALVGLHALELCVDYLKGFRLAIYLASDDVILSGRLFSQRTGIPVEFIPNCSHEEMLQYHGKARISIGLSISDAISTSFLEALVMGSFPIQSCTSCADEWIQDGKSGFIVPPEDPNIIAISIKQALLDDALVNKAAMINWEIALDRLDNKKIKPQVVQMYQDIVIH